MCEHVYDGKSVREGITLIGKEWKGCSESVRVCEKRDLLGFGKGSKRAGSSSL